MVPFFGSLTASTTTALLHPALAERTWIYEIDRLERLSATPRWTRHSTANLPLDPMHGTVGVAPALGEVRSSLARVDWGRNMDTPEMRGCDLLPGRKRSQRTVQPRGRARQAGRGVRRGGHGAMDTVPIVDLVNGVSTPWPRLESDEFLMTTGSIKPLADVFRIAQMQTVRWVAELTGQYAYQLVSQTCLSPVANVVDTVYTMVSKAPKAVFSEAVTIRGVHAGSWHASAGWQAIR